MSNAHHTPSYKRHRFPKEVISYAVWLYFRFCLSHRDIEDLLAERGIQVSYEAIRLWCLKFGHAYARKIRHRRPRTGDKWHVDEVFVKIGGKTHYLYRAVDQDGHVLDIFVHRRRNKQAAIRFFRKVLGTTQDLPRVLITDKLRSYPAAHGAICPGVEHRQHKGLNNRAENSHKRVRKRERFMQRFPAAWSAQRFLSAYELIYEQSRPKRHLMTARVYRCTRDQRLADWRQLTRLAS